MSAPTEATVVITRLSFVSTRGDRVHISHALFGGPPHQSTELCVAAAYELGRDLVDHAEGLLAGVGRPWDADPGRVPFASTGRPAARQRSGRPPGRSHPSGSAAPAIRPGRAVD